MGKVGTGIGQGHRPQGDGPELSVVLPVHNEEDSLPPVYEELAARLGELGKTHEIILVDDGSRDRSFEVIRGLHRRDPDRVVGIRFRRNFGQTAAMAAGFDHARGGVIIAMDADGQNDPADIKHLLEKLDEGYDIVSGWRAKRQEGLIRRLPSRCANWLISRVTGVYLHDYGCSLKAYRRGVTEELRLYGDLHRFIPAIATWRGATVAELPVNHRKRTTGRSKYGLGRTRRVLLDLLTVKYLLGYSTKPMQLFGTIGLASGAVGAIGLLILGVQRIFFGVSLANRPVVLLAAILLITGAQLLLFGLLAEMLTRIYHESQGRPIYAVREMLDSGGGEAIGSHHAPEAPPRG
jgi:glycosyltransferase involved in cell wall biosynthesis